MNIVMIAIDALRADRLGCYGYRKPTSPFIDALARRGVVFENHFTPVAPTQPAFTTIFSGVHPLTHRIFAHEGSAQPNAAITWLPLLMRHHGLCSVAIDNLVDQKPWFARGFEYYVNPRRRGEFPDCRVFNQRAIEWLTHCRREPFFLHLHYWDTHTPYLARPEYRGLFYEGDPTTTHVGSLDAFYNHPQVERWPKTWFAQLLEGWPHKTGPRIEDVDFILAQYDAEVRAADDGVREICQALQQQGLLDDTLLILYSDHGEELGGDHGIYFDHHGLYDSNLRCPLIFHWPKGLSSSPLPPGGGREGGSSGTGGSPASLPTSPIPGKGEGKERPAGRRVFAMSQHQDLIATVLDALGKEVPTDVIEGRSLLPLARGQATLSHWNHTLLACESTWQAKWALRTSEYKLIVSREPDLHGNPPVEVYDLLEDPGERTNLAGSDPTLTRTLLERFDALLKTMLEERGHPSDPIRRGATTLGRRFFIEQGKPYPPPPPAGWVAHPAPRLAQPAPGAAAKG